MAGGPPPADAGPAARGSINQSATGAGPEGEGAPYGSTPAGATADRDPFEERPELYVGGAFVGGLVVAMLLRRLTS